MGVLVTFHVSNTTGYFASSIRFFVSVTLYPLLCIRYFFYKTPSMVSILLWNVSRPSDQIDQWQLSAMHSLLFTAYRCRTTVSIYSMLELLHRCLTSKRAAAGYGSRLPSQITYGVYPRYYPPVSSWSCLPASRVSDGGLQVLRHGWTRCIT